MAKKKIDPLIGKIEREFTFGQFISYNCAYDFIRDLEDLKNEIADIASSSPERAVALYEVFLHGCTEKIEEMDDSSGGMGMFFSDLFCSWVAVRQKANCSAEDTLDLIKKWQEKDDYCLCYDLEKELIKVFNKKTLDLLKNRTLAGIEKGMASSKKGDLSLLPYEVRSKVELIKQIYDQKNNSKKYIEFVEKYGVTKDDCECIAKIFHRKKKYAEALEWVEKGLDSGTKKGKASSSAYQLIDLKKDLLSKLGNNDEALEMAWVDFKKHPSSYSYSDLMEYVPKQANKNWHEKVISFIKDGPIEPIFDICAKTKEYEVLVGRILKSSDQSLESLGHYSTGKVAEALIKKFPKAAAKVYRAQGVRIVKSKKSKYYHIAWEHFEMTKKLYHKTGQDSEWTKLVEEMVREHSRKSSFIGGFKEIVAGTKKKELSFAERAAKRWD